MNLYQRYWRWRLRAPAWRVSVVSGVLFAALMIAAVGQGRSWLSIGLGTGSGLAIGLWMWIFTRRRRRPAHLVHGDAEQIVFSALINMKAVEAGGRSSPVRSGWRPTFDFGLKTPVGDTLFVGLAQVELAPSTQLAPGKAGLVKVFIHGGHREVLQKAGVRSGTSFDIYEGEQCVANGTVQQVL